MQKYKFKILPYILVSIAVFLFVAYRAYHLGLTYDEAYSYTFLCGNRAFIIANNHWLSTFFSFISSRLFGFGEFSLRLPNVLSLILFLFFCYRLVEQETKPFLGAFFVFCFMIFNQFILDFFGLFRGYGLALAFFAGSFFFFLRLYEQYKKKDFYLALLFSLLTIYSNYAFLYPIIGLQLVFAFYYIRRIYEKVSYWKEIIYAFILEGFLLLPAVCNIILLKRRALLFFGGETGFLNDTFDSVLQYTYIDFLPFNTTILEILFAFLLVAGIFLRNSPKIKPLLYVIGISILLPIGLHTVLGIKYAIERSTLYWTVLLGVYFIRLWEACISTRVLKYACLSIISILCFYSLFSFAKKGNKSYTSTWKYDANTCMMLENLNTMVSKNKKYTLGIDWHFEPTINYYRETKHYYWLDKVSSENIKQQEYDFYFIFDTTLPDLSVNLSTKAKYSLSNTSLLQKK